MHEQRYTGAAGRPGLAALRVATGLLFMGHGAQKLFGALGGRGLAGTTEEMESLGLYPGRPNAALAGAAQFGGGALLAAGLWTPWAASAVNATLLVAMRTACSGRGFWAVNGGVEYPLALVACTSVLVAEGPGRPSLDSWRGRERSGAAMAALGLATAWLGGDLALKASRRGRSPKAEKKQAGGESPEGGRRVDRPEPAADRLRDEL